MRPEMDGPSVLTCGLQGLERLNDVRAVSLEGNGQISVLPAST